MSAYFAEAARQARELRPAYWWPRQPCCRATSRPCATPIREVYLTLTGCIECGHPKGCHT